MTRKHRHILLVSGILLCLLNPVSLFSQVVLPGEEFEVDTTANDSLPVYEESEIEPDTRQVLPDRMFAHLSPERTAGFEMSRLHHFDRLDSVQGFVQTLGQIGKPYLASRYGFSDRYFEQKLWRNPLYGRYNPYVINPATQVPHFDTRTQYVVLNYSQGGQGLQLIDGILSRNISSNFNITGYYQNRRSDGVYRYNTTNQRVLALALYYRDRSRRYHAFLNGTYNDLTDQMNGGLLRTRGSSLNQSFQKDLENPLLRNAEAKRIIRGAYLDQQYHLIGPPPMPPLPKVRRDSSGKKILVPVTDSLEQEGARHRLSLRLITSIENASQDFENAGIDVSRLASSFVTPLPTLNPDTNGIAEALQISTLKIRGMGSYSFSKKGFYANLQGALALYSSSYTKDSSRWHDDRTEQWVKGNFHINGLNLDLDLEARRTSSTLFDAETYAIARLDLHPRLRRASADTVKGEVEESDTLEVPEILLKTTDPLSLFLTASFYDQNPSFYQRFYRASPGNLYKPNPNLLNQQMLHLRGGLKLSGNRLWVREDTSFANFLSATLFYSRASRFIYYTPSFEVLQAGPNQGLTWIGVELQGRIRLIHKIYFEAQITLQQGSSGDAEGLEYYSSHLPTFYSKASLYYDNRNISFAGRFRIGADLYFFNSYRALGVDALSGEFYPSNYTVQPYPRVDLYFATQIKSAYVWMKLIHVNEFLLAPGYYTTPFYPELERTFTLGINWTFFD